MKLSSTIAGAPKLLPTSTKVGSPPVVKPYQKGRKSISSKYETSNALFIHTVQEKVQFLNIHNNMVTENITILFIIIIVI